MRNCFIIVGILVWTVCSGHERETTSGRKWFGKNDLISKIQPDETKSNGRSPAQQHHNKPIGFFEEFQKLDKIDAFLDGLLRQFPNITRYESLGKTYEGNDIKLIVISNSTKPKPKLIYVQAGLHAREWIAHSTALYFLTSILANYEKLSTVLADVEINVVPVANPDGYKYSHTTSRMWRKNREPNPGSHCIGTDLNRNFAFHWKETGTSSDPCSNTYGGSAALSSTETRLITEYLSKNKQRLKGFVDLHSFGSYLFYPYGYKRNSYYKQRNLKKLAIRMANFIKRSRGTRYQVGTAANLIYESAGGSDDWTAGKLGVPYVFTIELPYNTFIVDRSEIVPIGRETTSGLLTLLDAVRRLK